VQWLYSPEAQKIIAKHYYRPRDTAATSAAAAKLPDVQLFTIDEVFGGWAKAHKEHFADGATFDQIYVPSGGAAASTK
jgi:sulfate transport system substrate-binding protein